MLETDEYLFEERVDTKRCLCSSYCCLSGTCVLLSIRYNVYTCHSPIYHYIIVTVVYLVYRIIAVCRGYVIMELVSPKDEWSARTLGVLEIEEYLFKERFNTK